MTVIPTYVPLVPLPAPVTTGGTQFYTDPNGDVWVANPTVSSGAWARARSALFCRAYRSAAYSTPGAPNGVQIPFDTAYVDPYKLFTAPNIVIPIYGLWLCGAVFEVQGTTAGDVVGYYMGIGGGQVYRSGVTSMGTSATGVMRQQSIGVLQASPGNYLQCTMEYTTGTRVVSAGDAGRTAIWAQYIGP
jgi:hypothetical protein